MLFDEIMCLKRVLWRRVNFKRDRAAYICLLFVVFFFVINFHLNFNSICSEHENITYYYTCQPEFIIWMNVKYCLKFYNSNFWISLLFKVNAYVYFILPFFCLIVLTSHLFYLIKIKKNRLNKLCKNQRMKNKLLNSSIRLVFGFFFFNFPFSIIG